jgi:hypothetical protein
MAWIFALGIIWLCVVHEGFRKLILWIGGITLTVVAVCLAVTFKG